MYTGLTGALKITHKDFGPATLAYISGWSIEDKTEVVETTKLGRIHKDAVTSFQSWSASADGVVVFENDRSQESLFLAKYKGQKVLLEFYLNDAESKGKSTYFSGEGYIESLSVDLSAEDKGNISISIKGTGSLALIANGDDIMKNQLNPGEEYFRLKFNENDGCLYAIVPERLEGKIRMEGEYLVVTV